MNNSTPHTNTRGGGGRNKEEKDTNTPPTLATTRASPKREGKSRKRTPRKADPQKRRRWGGGRTTPRKPGKDTRDLTQPNLPGDATDQPNPNTKTHYREGPKGDKQITTKTKSCHLPDHVPCSSRCWGQISSFFLRRRKRLQRSVKRLS